VIKRNTINIDKYDFIIILLLIVLCNEYGATEYRDIEAMLTRNITIPRGGGGPTL